MLDKSIPFFQIIMRRKYGGPDIIPSLPEGYSIRGYKKGDEIAWAEIEASVLEFENVEQALECHKGYDSRSDELPLRQWFVIGSDGIAVATATAWYIIQDGIRIPVVHALGCRPEYQGKGLGMAVAAKMLESFYRLEPNRDIWLDTQTWSYKAIGIYMKLGFIPMKTDTYQGINNDYYDALPVLKQKMRPEEYKKFVIFSR